VSGSNTMEVRGYSLGLGVIRVCWIIFIIAWLLGMAWTKRTIYRESSAERARYWLALVVGYFLVIKSSAFPSPFNWLVVPHRTSSSWGGVFLCVSGLVLAIWARLILGRNWSGVITLKEGHELIERGPYRVVRHPIYTGILAMLAGTAIALGYFGGFIGFLLVFISFWMKLKREEDLMLEHFPAKYAAYQRRVKRLIPFLV
jgi:protein-S-isoprenylcysteine O-methyltransferase Ste14